MIKLLRSRRRQLILQLLTLILVVGGRWAHARPADSRQATASRFTRIASGVRMAQDIVVSILAPSWWYSKDEITPTNVTVYFVGQGRTGTTSIASAMNILGYKTLHDDENPSVMDLYGAWCRGEIDEDELHYQIGQRGYNCSFVRSGYKWAAKQDNVKVIVTKRDPEEWVDSWLVVAPIVDLLGRRPYKYFKPLQDVLPHLEERAKVIPTGGHPEKYLDRDALLKGYEIHLQNVRDAVPADRLLEYTVHDGWGPLCDFLGVPAPDAPFPHVNDRVRVRAAVFALFFITWIWPVVTTLPFFFLAFMVTRSVKTAKKTRSVRRSYGQPLRVVCSKM